MGADAGSQAHAPEKQRHCSAASGELRHGPPASVVTRQATVVTLASFPCGGFCQVTPTAETSRREISQSPPALHGCSQAGGGTSRCGDVENRQSDPENPAFHLQYQHHNEEPSSLTASAPPTLLALPARGARTPVTRCGQRQDCWPASERIPTWCQL